MKSIFKKNIFKKSIFKTQKKYTLGIAAIVCVMFFSVAYYILRVVQENNHLNNIFDSLSYLMAGNFTNTKDTEGEFEEQSQVYNYLVDSDSDQKYLVSKSINTKTGYNCLPTDGEKLCYKLIKSNCNNITNTSSKSGLYSITPITVKNSKLSPLQIKKVLYAIQNDNPDIFWIASSFSYQYSGNNTVLKLNSIFSHNNQQKAIKKLSKKVASILSGISSDSSAYQKELYVHNYIVKNCKYSYQKDNQKIYTSYGCLVENKAVCEGYAKATQLLLNTLGIGCDTITGYKGKEAHMWNIVKIKDRWYHLDVTWDSSGNLGRYNYFNLDDKTIKVDHTINDNISALKNLTDNKRYNFNLPKCSSMVENYYTKNAVKIDKLDTNAIIKKLVDLSAKKKKYLYIKITKNYGDIKNQLLTQKQIFKCIKNANNQVSKNKISTSKLNYSECKAQKVLIIELFY